MTDIPQVPLATLQQWLDEARTAYHELMIGQRAVTLRHNVGGGDKGITYEKANADKLLAYINRLEAQIAGKNRPTAVGVIF
jgi:hypothetical protein